MYVKTKVLQSDIHGLGLFADEFIPKGTILWKFTPGFDQKFTQTEIDTLPERAQKYLKFYAYLSKKSNKHIFPVDDGKYFNHSDDPNSKSAHFDDEEEVVTRAIKDIQKGEEITDNYNLFEEKSPDSLPEDY